MNTPAAENNVKLLQTMFLKTTLIVFVGKYIRFIASNIWLLFDKNDRLCFSNYFFKDFLGVLYLKNFVQMDM